MWRKKRSIGSSTQAISFPRSGACAPSISARSGYGHEAASFETAAQPHVLQLRIKLAEIDHDEIVGNAIERVAIAAAGLAAPSKQRLVIPRDQTLVARLRARHPVRREVLLEEPARGVGRRAPCPRGDCARLAPELALLKRGAACEQRAPRFGDVVVAPSRQLAPRDATEHRHRRCRRRRRLNGCRLYRNLGDGSSMAVSRWAMQRERAALPSSAQVVSCMPR